MQIRKSTTADIPRMQEIFAYARGFMQRTGNPNQWDENYPTLEMLQRDIAQGVSFVCEHQGRLVGTFMLVGGDEPTYAEIYQGAWKNNRPYGTIHRIASSGEVKGIFTEAISFALERYGTLRIDTHRDNKVMQTLVERVGFEYCGIIYCFDGTERLAYQLN